MTARFRKRRKKGQPKRFVYLVTRPIAIARTLHATSLSESKDECCHWGVLVSIHDPEALTKRREEYYEMPTESPGQPLGTCIELRRRERSSTYNVNTDFGWDDLRSEWRIMKIKYIGMTGKSDCEISHIGKRTLYFHLLTQ